MRESSPASKPCNEVHLVDSILITSNQTSYSIMNYGIEQIESSNRAVIRHANGTQRGHRRHNSHNSHIPYRSPPTSASSPRSLRSPRAPIGVKLSMDAFLRSELPPQARQQQYSAYQTQRKVLTPIGTSEYQGQYSANSKLSSDQPRTRHSERHDREQEISFFDWDSGTDADNSALRKMKSTFKLGQNKRHNKAGAPSRFTKDENATPRALNTIAHTNLSKTRLQALHKQPQSRPPDRPFPTIPISAASCSSARPLPTERKSYDTSPPSALLPATPSKPPQTCGRGRSPPLVPPPKPKSDRHEPPTYPHMLRPKSAPGPRLSSDDSTAMLSTYNGIAQMQQRQRQQQLLDLQCSAIRHSPRMLRPSYEEGLEEGYPGNEAQLWDDSVPGNPPPTPTSLNSNNTGGSKSRTKRVRALMHDLFAKASIQDLRGKARSSRSG